MARRVDLKDQSPLIIKQENLTNGSCAVCRCGLSGHWPMCDGTHKATIGEEPGKLYRYERELPQGTVRRIEIGAIDMPGRKADDTDAGPGEKSPQQSEHGGVSAHRPRRPERGVSAEATRGNEAGVEGKSGEGPSGAGDELITGGKNRSGQGGESA